MHSKKLSQFIIFLILISVNNNVLYSANKKQQPVRFKNIEKQTKQTSNKEIISKLIKAMFKKEKKERDSNETMIKKEIEYLSALHVLLSAARIPNNDIMLKTDNAHKANKKGQYYCKYLWGLRAYKKILKSVYEDDEPFSLIFIQKVEKLLRKSFKRGYDPKNECFDDDIDYADLTRSEKVKYKAIAETTKLLLLKLNTLIISKLDDRIHRRIARAITIPLITSMTKTIYWRFVNPRNIALNYITKLPEYIFIEIAAERILQSIEKAQEEK